MFEIPCFSNCFGRRSGKRYKEDARGQPPVSSKAGSLEDTPRPNRHWRSNSIMTNRSFSPPDPVAMIPTNMEYTKAVEEIRQREYPNMQNGWLCDFHMAVQ